jgi:cytochrome oxidase Cu insertion factor (SCO1/SenC/PrrC family)
MSSFISQPPRKVEWAVWAGLAVIAFAIFLAFIVTQLRAKPLPVYGTLPDFTLTNQNGQTVTLATFHGQVWIADAIFTRCPGQCLQMSAHMTEIQHALPPGQFVQLVSFTTDPAFDQPHVLKKYGDRFGAMDDRWSFLTGDKSALHRVEVDGLKLSVLDKPAAEQEGANDLFIHSEKFVLLDKLGRIRGYYDGQNARVVSEIAGAAQTLAHE